MTEALLSVSGSMVLRGFVGSVVCLILLAIGCNDSQKSQEFSKSAPQATAIAPPAPPPVALQFTDVTSPAGVIFHHETGATGKKWDPETMGAGGGFFDYDGDGWLDILLVNGRQWPGERQEPEPTMRLYRNRGDGTFEDVTQRAGLVIPLYGMGMVVADYDNNGTQDLCITGYRETRLFRNNGDGTFTDVTPQSGIAQGSWTTAAAFVDVDRDAWLDLVIGLYVDCDLSKKAKVDF